MRRLEKMSENVTREEVENGSRGGIVVLTLEHFQGPFFVLILGYMCGGATLFLELSLRLLKNGKKTARFRC